ncbi:MAG TPA: hypothetical protein VGF95_04395 [Solirubrobacteraceae bacterium]|jgi:hypothetical protein
MIRAGKSMLALTFVLCCAALAPALASADGTGSIAGTVTEAGGAEAAIPRTKVCASQQGGGEVEICQLTNNAGDYTLGNLPEGDYIVEFSGQTCVNSGGEEVCSPTWALQFYDGAAFGLPQTLVHVEEGEPTEEINAALEAFGEIEGVVESTAGGPIANTLVCANATNGVYWNGCAFTDDSGKYTITDLVPAEYYVEFRGSVCEPMGPDCTEEACNGLKPICTRSYVQKVYLEGIAAETPGSELVNLKSGEAATAGATLTPAGKIEGTVTSAVLGKAGIEGIEVCAEATEGEFINECVETDASGHYRLEGLSTTSYDVGFHTERCNETEECTKQYAMQYYNDTGTQSEATRVEVNAPDTSTGVNASLQEVSQQTPTSLTAPVLSGSPSVGETLSCSEGTWENGPTMLAYAWLRNGAIVVGQSEGSYEVTIADEGASLTCEVVVANEAGLASESSNTLTVPAPESKEETPPPSAPQQPGFAAGPSLSGNANVGDTLSCTTGTWVNDPTSTSYAWLRNGIPIAGQNGSTYTVSSEDEGVTLTCVVTVTNAAGSASVPSNALTVLRSEISTPTEVAKAGVAAASAKARAKSVSLTLACKGEGTCKGSLRLVYEAKAHGKAKKVTIGSASFAIAANSSQAVAVKLTAKGAGYVTKAGKHGLKVKLSGSGVKPRTLLVKS